jgi:NADH-quinone oxidoreductase subunit G
MHRENGSVPDFAPAHRLSNASTSAIDLSPCQSGPAPIGIYALDGIVRRATSLQLTADARASHTPQASQEVAA